MIRRRSSPFLSLVLVLLAVGCGRPVDNLTSSKVSQLRHEAELLVRKYEDQGRQSWKKKDLSDDTPVIASLKPNYVSVTPFVSGTNTIGYQVAVRIRGGFSHEGLLIVVGDDVRLAEVSLSEGKTQGWANQKIGDRVFKYAE